MIDGIGRNQPPQIFTAASAPATSASPSPAVAGQAGAGDNRAKATGVHLSGVAREMAATPPVDAARVATIRLAIAEGSYKVDPDAIAARMITFDRGSRGV